MKAACFFYAVAVSLVLTWIVIVLYHYKKILDKHTKQLMTVALTVYAGEKPEDKTPLPQFKAQEHGGV